MKKVILALSCFIFLSLLSPNLINAACTKDADCPEHGQPVNFTHCVIGAGTCTAPAVIGAVGCKGDPGFVCTALGDIPTEPVELVKWFLKNAIIMGGGIAFLLSVFGGVSIILAGGNPEKINAGKEIISSALTGLLFIVFSVFLLRLIGFDILQLPGFSKL